MSCSDEPAADAVAILAAMRAGNCTGHSWRLPTLDLALLPANESRPLAGALCPAIIHSAATRSGVEEISLWSSWSRLEDLLLLGHQDKTIEYDASVDSRFTYWDNATALAPEVRTIGVASQGYMKVRGSPASFLKRAISASDATGRVRYGSSLAAFSSTAGAQLGLKLPQQQQQQQQHDSGGRLSALSPAGEREATAVGLWISAAGVTSTYHFDRGDNLHIVLTGEKTVRLAPPSLESFASLGIRPCTHPNGRQARRAPAEVSAEAAANTTAEKVPSAAVHAISTVLTAGSAVFMPAGWLHELQTGSAGPAAALSLTSRPFEDVDFTAFISDVDQHAPFIREAFGGEYSRRTARGALLVYVPALLRELQVDARALHAAFAASYDADTQLEAGIVFNDAPSLRRDPRCEPTADPAERAIIELTAARVAERLRDYRAALLPHYLMLYLDVLLIKVGGTGDAPVVLSRMMAWVHACGDEWLFPAT